MWWLHQLERSSEGLFALLKGDDDVLSLHVIVLDGTMNCEPIVSKSPKELVPSFMWNSRTCTSCGMHKEKKVSNGRSFV